MNRQKTINLQGMGLFALCCGLVLATLAPTPFLRAQDQQPSEPGESVPDGEVTLKHPDGSTKAVATYRGGLLEGEYRAYAENGQMVVSARFRRGVLTSRLQRWKPNGDRLETATYREGMLHGSRVVFSGRRPALTQEYKLGELIKSEGNESIIPEPVEFLLKNDPAALLELRFGAVEPVPEALALGDPKPSGYPMSLEELKQKMDEIAEMPVKGAETEAQALATRRTMLHRLVSGVPNYTLNHDPKDGEAATIGSEIMHLNQALEHEPANPGMDEARFKRGFFATSKGNIAQVGRQQKTAADVVDQWVIDPGDNNRDEVGHRRWIFVPGLFEIGYGSFEKYHTMVIGTNFKRGARYGLITYPGQGYVPNDMVPGNCIWSVHPSPTQYKFPESANDIEVNVFRLTTDGKREAVQIQRTHLTQETGMPVPALLFEPVINSSEHNRRFEVHIDGLIPSSRRYPETLSYIVHFVDFQQLKNAETDPAEQ